MLKLIDVTKTYESPAGRDDVTVLDGISLTVEQGQSLAVVGPSGCGKSTLLNIIGALDRPTTGRVMLGDRNLAELNDKDLAGVRNKEIGFVFQLHHLLPQCTVLENVVVPTLADGSHQKPEVLERAGGLLRRVGLAEFIHHKPGELSGGQRQRVAVVRALINQPKLLLADEPTGSLDRASAENIAKLLVELNESENTTLIVVTHSAEFAAHMARTHELKDGRLDAGETK